MKAYEALVEHTAKALHRASGGLDWEDLSTLAHEYYRRCAKAVLTSLDLKIQHGQLIRPDDEDSILAIDDPIAGRAAAEAFHFPYTPRIRFTTPWMEDPDAPTDEQPVEVADQPQPPAA